MNDWMDDAPSKDEPYYKHKKPLLWEKGLRLELEPHEEGFFTTYQVRYHSLLGSGAFGKVDHVERLNASGEWHEFALKVIWPRPQKDGTPRLESSFEREIEVSEWIRETNATGLLGASAWGIRGKLNGYLFYPLAKHGSLQALLNRVSGQQLGPVLALQVAKQLLEALRPFHAAGWAHRDIKPDNILITSLEEYLEKPSDLGDESHEPPLALGVSKLTVALGDFGIAGRGDALKNTSGTPGYTAPEVTNSAGASTLYGPECDLFSVAVVLYQLLTGKRPFRDDDITNKLERREAERDASIRGFTAEHFIPSHFPFPPGLVSLIAMLGSVDPAHRPSIQSALDVIESLLEDLEADGITPQAVYSTTFEAD
jgi:serine/threonine protein kinase